MRYVTSENTYSNESKLIIILINVVNNTGIKDTMWYFANSKPKLWGHATYHD